MEWVKEAFQKYEPKPKGWVTVSEIQEQTNQSLSTIRRKVTEMLRAGILEEMWCLEKGLKVKCYRKKGKK